MKQLFYILIVLSLIRCGGESAGDKASNEAIKKPVPKSEIDSIKGEVSSNVDESMLGDHNRKEFYENLRKIEKEHGVQWDFCTCAIKNDSINKAINALLEKDNYTEAQLDKLIQRSDTIEKKCKSFISQDPSQTPDQREEHQKKIKKCLKEAGIND